MGHLNELNKHHITTLKQDKDFLPEYIGFQDVFRCGLNIPNGNDTKRFMGYSLSGALKAFDVETAIMEIAPKLEQPISVAEIEMDRDIKVFDFNSYHEGEEATGLKLAFLSKLFSLPNYKDESEYLPTQYLCEYIRELGFEGVCFNSSVNAGHKNLVIFDCDRATRPYKINGSKVYKVNEQNIKYEQIVPELKTDMK